VVYGRVNPGEMKLLRENPVVRRTSLAITEMAFSGDLD
jgi:hypothetical protein